MYSQLRWGFEFPYGNVICIMGVFLISSELSSSGVIDGRRCWGVIGGGWLWNFAVFLGFACLFGAVQNVGYFDASDSMNRFQMMQSLLMTGSPNWVEAGLAEPQVCLNTVGPAIAALPFEAVAWVGYRLGLFDGQLEQVLIRATLLGTVFCTALWMCVLAKLCRMLAAGRRGALGVCMVAGICTMIFPYSKSAQAENLVGLGITSIVVLLLKFSEHRGLWHVAAAGLIYAFLLTCKNELAAVFPVLFMAVVLVGDGAWLARLRSNWKAGAVLCVMLLPGIAVVLWFNYARFGEILKTGHLGDSHDAGLLKPFNYPFWRGIYLQMLSPGKGLLWYCPVLLASMPLMWIFLRRAPRMLWVGYAWWAVMTCVYAKWYSPAGDTALGSRFQVSYLAFGVMPLLMLVGKRGVAWGFYKGWVGFCVAVSFAMQALFCAVSFNIDFHRMAFSVDTIPEKLALLDRMYYTLDESLLRGFFRTASERLLDMYFVRWEPLEGALTVLPGFWVLLCFAAVGFGAACWMAGKRDDVKEVAGTWRDWRRGALCQLPATAFAVLALVRFGYPGDNGLRLRVHNDAGAEHKTIVQDIAISNMDDGRVLYAVASPAELRWRGEMFCEQVGTYSFEVESNQAVKIELDGVAKTTESGRSVVDFAVTESGWLDIEVRCYEVQMYDGFEVRCRRPGDDEFVGLVELQLRH